MAALIENKVQGPMPFIASALMAALVEYALGKMTAQQVIDAFALDATEQTEAQAMLSALRNGNTAMVGNTPPQRAFEMQSVFFLAAHRIAPYVDAATVRTRLGLP